MENIYKFILKRKTDKQIPNKDFESYWKKFGITIIDDSMFPEMMLIETNCPSNIPQGIKDIWDVFLETYPEKNYKIPDTKKEIQ